MMYRDLEEYHFCDLYDLALTTPHCLIGGTTGSGKSVLLNGILYNFLRNYGVDNGLVLIDPKRVELSAFRNAPHCIGFATESAQVVNYLNQVINIIEQRYKKLQSFGMKQWDGQHIFIVIDEIADLMLSTDRRKIEMQLQKITQIGRAANVHLICATQLIRADILTPKITGNIPTKIALRCVNALESRQICGKPGAELLPHHGYCMVQTPQNIGIEEYQIPYISDSEIAKLINKWNTMRIK